ncbi:MAG: LysM peptidoglycan-binding domain-containing protein [Candidatus Obscuribacter sp.]|nr:LysM peptidoglycan-binding domain-containing protein [Candidatus Obscuribacter sp.]MBK9277240.1 LysM peptidoglycan-binding domain-containing protein [Candidatus Obscuribacter sp.]
MDKKTKRIPVQKAASKKLIARSYRALSALALSALTILGPCPFAALAEGPSALGKPAKRNSAQIQVPQPKNAVKTGPKTVKLIKPTLNFSSSPTDSEITSARVFLEPLIPMSGEAVAGENQALAKAILKFKSLKTVEDLSPLTEFVKQFPNSRWIASLNSNIADLQYESGYLSDALERWESSWERAKTEKGSLQQSVANHSVANLLKANGRLGRIAELEKYLAAIKGRAIWGSDEQKINDAKQGYGGMKTEPGIAFKCGPYAVHNVLNAVKPGSGIHPVIEKARSTKEGTNLLMVKELAAKTGLNFQIAKRSPGASVITPSVMHWKLDHFGALTAEKNGRYELKDPTFDTAGYLWLSAKTIDAQSDGYFLIPVSEKLPSGWSAVSDEEASKVWGKGEASQQDATAKRPETAKMCMSSVECGCNGMANASAFKMAATLNIEDTPLSYQPPVGPGMDFHFNYNHLEANQPSTFTFSNLGQNWTFNWLSYLTVDSVSSVATVRVMGGGSEQYTPDSGTGLYPLALESQAQLVNMGSGVYERRLPNGAVQVFNQSDSSSPPRIFMTSMTDPQGLSVQIQYDSNFRIVSITDAIGQVSTVSYVSNTSSNPGFYKIASVTDPFSRSCSFEYDSSVSKLISITDVVGLKSQFAWDNTSSFITQMTTPYGTTSFYQYVPGTVGGIPAQGLRFTFSDGTSSVIENWLNEAKTTYFWDRHATQLYPADPANHVYTHCEQIKFTFNLATGYEGPVKQWEIHPLESQSPIYYTYPSAYGANFQGNSNKPLSITRSLGVPVAVATVAGTITPGDIMYLGVESQYVAAYTVQSGDTATSIAASLTSIINNNSTLQSLTVLATAVGPTVCMHSDMSSVTSFIGGTSAGATETLKVLSPTRQSAIATMSGPLTVGDVLYVYVGTPYPHSGTGQRYLHTVVSGDTYNSILSDIASQLNADSVVQAFNASATVSGDVISLYSFNPEAQVWQVGTWSGTFNTVFTLSNVRTTAIQKTEYQRNSLGNPTQVIDPLARKFSYSYASNNIDLLEAREIQSGDNYLMGHWEYNSFHQPTVYIDGSGQQTHYTYNSLQQPLTITDANSNVTTFTYTGTSSATVGGTVSSGDVLTVMVHDAGLSGGQKAVNYTVSGGDTLTTIATGIKNAINADSNLTAIGVSATSSGAVVTLISHSVNVTTYTKSTSGGATETISLGSNTYGYLTKIDGPMSGSNDVTTITYDGFGRVYSVRNSEGYELVYSYDDMNRPTRTTYPDGTFEETIWNRLDPVLQKDRNGRTTQSAYNSLDQKTYEIDPQGRKTQYTWCTCGSLAALTDPNNNTTQWHHDIQGRLTSKVYPDSSTVSYTYEPFAGWLRARTDALSQITRYYFNPDNTPLKVGYANPVKPTGGLTYSWDLKFKRLTDINKSDWGTYSYTYNPYITSAYGTPTTGGGMLQQVHNNVIANSDITYTYDALGRTTNRSINGSANSITWAYDAMSRVTSEVNALGTFTYNYVDNASGASKGDTRLASIDYPNGQVTKFDWYPTESDERLQQIRNLGPSGNTISQFSYRYDPAGQIKQWQQLQGNTSLNYALDYDQAGQLTSATASGGPVSAKYLKQYHYAYDPGANRTGVQTNSVTRARLTGTVTTGNVLTVTVSDSALTGGSKGISYTVVGGDTLQTIATKLAAAIASDTDMLSIGVTASSNDSTLSIKSSSPNVTSYTSSTSSGATTAIALNVTDNFVENAVVGSTKTTGDVLTVTFKDAALTGGAKNVSYTVLSGDTLASIATAIKNAINADTDLQGIGVSATSIDTSITIRSSSTNATTYAQSVSTGATETITLLVNQNGQVRVGIGGSKTTGDSISIVTYDAGLSGGSRTVSYTVQSGDTLSSIASGIASALNADSALQGVGVSASASGRVISLQSNSLNATTYRATTSSSATEVVLIDLPPNGVQTAVIGGTKTTGDVLTVNVYDAQLSGGSKAISYTVGSSDTLTTIATNVAAALNADTDLQGINVSATSSGTVVNILSASTSATSYTSSLSGGATETVSLAPSTSANLYGYNNLNELTSIAAGGPTRFQGGSNKALKSASVDGNAASLPNTLTFRRNASLSSGSDSVPVSVTDGSNTTVSQNYKVSTKGSSSASPTFDANGNMTSDGTNTYEWDAENRLIKINYPGSGNYSQFSFDTLSRNVKIVDTSGSSTTITKQFVWSGSGRCEERDGSGALAKQLFEQGQRNGSANFCYAVDHLGSVREMTDSSGAIQAQYSFDVYGQATQTVGVPSLSKSDFQYAGCYYHQASELNLATYRAYNSRLGRWPNRDPIGELGGINLYAYVDNDPIKLVDPVGLWKWYGNYGGPGWASGKDGYPEDLTNFPYAPGDVGYRPPLDNRDLCYYRHDVCLHNAAFINNCEQRRTARRKCDTDLGYCLLAVQKNRSSGWDKFPNTINNEIGKFLYKSPNDDYGFAASPELVPFRVFDPAVVNP